MDFSPVAWLSLLALFFVQSTEVAASLSAEQEQKIDSFVQSAMKCWNVPGLSLAAVKGGKAVLSRGYGKADIENDIPVTDTTLFSAASISKQFSATLLGILLEEKGIPWRTNVKDLVDDFVMPSDYMTLHTTLEDIIAHRTGLVETMYLGQFSPEEAFQRLRLYKSQVGFREEFLYSGIVYSVSGIVSKRLGGKPWHVLMKERVFDPLGMAMASFFTPSLLKNGGVANPYNEETVGGKLVYLDPYVNAYTRAAAPAGGIAVTARCMAKYMEFLTNEGKDSQGSHILSTSALHELWKPLMSLPENFFGGYFQLPVNPFPRTIDEYAHGWMLGYYRGRRNVFHFGDLYGFDGLLSTFPQQKVGVYTNTNGPGKRRAVLANLLIQAYVTDIMLDEEPWLNETSVCSYRDYVKNEPGPQPPPPPSHIDKNLPASRPLSEYTGTYGDLSVGNFTVFINDTTGKLQVDFPPIVHFSLFATKVGDQFAVEVFGHMSFMFGLSTKYNPGALAQFVPNKNGKIDTLNMSMFGLTLKKDLKFEPDKIVLRKDCQA